MSQTPHKIDDIRIADVITFLTVRQCSSVTGAARQLRVTPSQVSKAIARLEHHLNATLLSRGARRVTVTSEGHRFAPRFDELLKNLRLIAAETHGASALTVAAPSYLGAIFLPELAVALPKLRFRALEMSPGMIRGLASENLFDAALTNGLERFQESWVATEVGAVRKGLFAHPDVVRKLGPQPVSQSRIESLPFVTPIYTANGQFLPTDDGCPLGIGVRKLGHEVQTLGLALALAVRTGQLVFGPTIAARLHVERKELAEILVSGWAVDEPLYVVCNRDRVLAKHQSSIVASLRATIGESTPS